MQRKVASGSSAQLPAGGEWKELLLRSKELGNMLQTRVCEDVLTVETAVCSSGQGSSKSTVCLENIYTLYIRNHVLCCCALQNL